MRRVGRLSWGVAAATVVLSASIWSAPSAYAIHFFSDCSHALSPAPATPSAGQVSLFYNTFTAPVTTIKAGESVTFTWGDPYCHSVTLGTYGTDLGATNPNLRSPDPLNPSNNTITLTFPTAGQYSYYCEHHWPIGMRGVINVT